MPAEKKGKEFRAYIPSNLEKRIMRDLKKRKYITPYQLSEEYDISISLARKLLRELSEKGELKLIAKTRRVAIYKPA